MFKIGKRRSTALTIQNTDEMEFLVSRADKLFKSNNFDGLKDLQKTIWRSLQAKLMLEPYIKADHAAGGDIVFNFCDFSQIHDCYQGEINRYISLSEAVITFPWHPDRIINNLGTIGEGMNKGKFTPSNNHSVNYYWPIMLAKVTGGNHSIAQGIIRGEGRVQIESYYDLTSLVNRYKCDGRNWIDLSENRVVTYCDCIELGMAWEVSRFIMAMGESHFQVNTQEYF
ncbi:DUF6710 family protein [Vibrio lentus]|uniref:DUF6710 family protein n=1 Tax=Vibrio lentus TaxID=136468 RepID=UPI0040643BE3